MIDKDLAELYQIGAVLENCLMYLPLTSSKDLKN